MNRLKALALLVALAAAVSAQAQQGTMATTTKATKKTAKASATDVADKLSELQRSLATQQQQIQQLQNSLQSRDAVIQSLQQQVTQAQSAATQAQQASEAAAAQASKQGQDVASVKETVTDLKDNQTNVALSLQDTQKRIGEAESPTTIHYKGVTITPGGFLAAETVWRQHALGSDINTPFNSVPYGGASQNSLSEFFGSGRQSRLSMLTEGNIGSAVLRGYVEADFLSAGITSNNNQSNSYSLRVRQAFAQGALNNGWTFTGGQMWSLVTETKKGLDNRSEALPMTIDPQYTIGFSWARQYGFRVTKSFDDKKVFLGVSAEDAQETTGGHGITCTTTISYPCNNYLLGSQGASGGLYNPTANYSFNAAPDFIFKAAFEPSFGGHYEVFGIVSDFRDRVFPGAIPATTTSTPTAKGAYNNSSIGTGVGANARGSLLNKHLDLGVHFLGGRGIGRYGTGGLPDLVIRPDGVLDPIKNYQALATAEFHGKKLDVYLNFGGEYNQRTTFDSGKTGIGYGSTLFNDSGCATETLPTVISTTVSTPTGTATVPTLGSTGTPISSGFNPGALSKCSGDTKNLLETSVGFWYRFYKGPKGTLQFGPQYSYVIRNGWSGGGIDPQGTENMFLTSFRYYLP